MDAPTLAAPFVLSDVDDAARVASGHVDVFAVRTDADGTPVGRRRHVCRRVTGEAVFAVPGGRVALLAVPSTGAELVPVDRALVDLASLVEGWVAAVGEGVFEGTPPKESVRPVPGEVLEVEEGAALRSRDGLVWVRFEEGGATLAGRPELTTNGRAVPVGVRPWLVTTAPTRAHVATTADRLAGAALDGDLDAFHGLVLDALAADEDRAAVAEGARATRQPSRLDPAGRRRRDRDRRRRCAHDRRPPRRPRARGRHRGAAAA